MSLTAKLLLSPLLVAQAVVTRARLPRLPEAEGHREGVAGEPGAGAALRLLVTGDSSAAGVGVATQRDALAAPLAEHLAAAAGVPVHWQLVARSGLSTAQTLELLRTATLASFDLAVVVTGVNDVIDQLPSQRAVAAREALANWLRNAAGVQHVAFAPLPPVRRFPGLPQPLRWIAGSDAERHDRALDEWARTRSDVSRVEIGIEVHRGVMAADGFHPGVPVYRQCAVAIAGHLAGLLQQAGGARSTQPPARWPSRSAAAHDDEERPR
jgi:lysophospholipase L1-like esterase